MEDICADLLVEKHCFKDLLRHKKRISHFFSFVCQQFLFLLSLRRTRDNALNVFRLINGRSKVISKMKCYTQNSQGSELHFLDIQEHRVRNEESFLVLLWKNSTHRNRKLLNKEQILFIALAPVLTNLTMTFLTDGREILLFPWEEQNAVSEIYWFST